MKKTKRILSLALSVCMLAASGSVLAVPENQTGAEETVLTAGETVTIDGFPDAGLPGGTLDKTVQFNFADAFEGDGSNGTNGTTPLANDKGLRAEKADTGIKFSSILGSGNGSRPNAVLLEQTYDLPQPTGSDPYYLTFDFVMQSNCKIAFDFGAGGTAGVMQLLRPDRDGSTPNADYEAVIGGSSRGTISYAHGKEMSLGLYLDPRNKKVAVYSNGQKLTDDVFDFTDAGAMPETMKVTWCQSSKWWSISSADYITLKQCAVYESAQQSETDQDKADADKEALSLGDISAVTENLTLPTIGSVNGSAITWESANEGVIRIDGGTGVVTRPQNDTAVTLTATITNGTGIAVQTFSVTVKGSEKNPLLPTEEQLEDIINDDFATLAGKSDSELRALLADMGYTITDGASDKLDFSATAEKGLFIKRNGVANGDLKFSREISDGSGIAKADTLLPGHNMKGGGKYYVDYTFSYDRTAIYINGCGNWKNVFCRTQINKDYPTELTVYGAAGKYKMKDQNETVHVQTVVDTKAGNATGSTAQCVSNVFVNDQHIAVNADNRYDYNGAAYYATFLQLMDFTLQGGNKAVDGGGLYLKNFRVSKVSDALPETDQDKADADKAALSLSDISAVTENLTLPTIGSVNGSAITWESANEGVIRIDGGTGVVTRPQNDTAVTLTATITNGTGTAVQTFSVTVKAKEQAVIEIGKNLALKKTVSGSAEAYSDQYGYAKVTDGDLTSRLATKDWVDLSNQWIQIDLGKTYRFNQLKLTEFNKRLKRFKLQYSADGQSWTDIETYSLDANNESGTFVHEPYQFTPAEGRYIRIYILENAKNPSSGGFVGVSIYEAELYYTGDYLVSYDPNAAQGEEGYMPSTAMADYGLSNPAEAYGSGIQKVNTNIESVKTKKGIMFSPRRKEDLVLRETGRMEFDKDTINKPKPMNDMENGYVFEQEFLSYTRTNLDGDGIWQYRLIGEDNSGEAVMLAALQTCLTKTDGKLPDAKDGIIYGNAVMLNTENSAALAFPAGIQDSKDKSPHVSFLRVFVDMRNQTYTAWMITRADVNSPYVEREPGRAQLLVRDEPFVQPVTQITGFQVWSQNTYGDQTYLTKLGIKSMDGKEVTAAAVDALSAEDLLGDNASAQKITTALELPEVYQSADVRWSVSPAGVLGEDGGIIAAPQQDTEITLTAVLSRGGASASKELKVTVSPDAVPETDARKVEIDTEALTLGDVSAVTENLNLVTVGPKRGSAVSWTSSDTSVIETDGTVHRPLRDAEVTLTAAISKGEAKQTKTFVVTVKGTQPSRTIAGIEGSYFSGGTFYETNAVKFADLFEGDGANGTNGTVYVEPSTEPDAAEINKFPGLVAEKTAEGIRYYARVHNAANPGRGLPIYEKTYQLPEMTDPSTPYYLEVSFKMKAQGALTFDFGQGEGGEAAVGSKGVMQVRKRDGNVAQSGVSYAGTPEGPALYDFRTNDVSRATASYADHEDASLGIYVIPELKEMVFYKNGQRVADKIFTYDDPATVLSTLHITWNQEIRYYGISSGDYLILKDIKLYQGPDIPAAERLRLDAEALTLSSISDEKAGQITKDLNLYTTGKFGSSIVWSSDNPAVIDPATGTVTRAAQEETVMLTAVISYGGESREQTFVLTVPKKGTDGNMATGGKVTMEGTSSIEDIANLTDGIFETYIETLDQGKKPKITIDLGEEKQFSKVVIYEGMADGRYAIQSGVLEVSSDKLTWTKVAETETVGANRVLDFVPVEARYIRFSVTGLAKDQVVRLYEIEAVMDASDAAVVKADMRGLKAFDTYNVTESAAFVTKGKFGSDIRWESQNTSLVDSTGKVSRPAGDGEKVTITAYVSFGAVTETVTFNHFITGTGGGEPKPTRKPAGGSGGGGGVSGGGGLVNVTDSPAPTQKPTDGPNGNDSVFEDVSTDSWAYPYIKSLYDEEILTGGGDGYFEPARPILREEYLKLLLLAMDVAAEPAQESVFADVRPDDWFAGYVNTAHQLGLVNGMPDGTFGIGQEITRQDMAVLAKRAADLKGIVLEQKEARKLADMEQVSGYAKESVQALADAAIISGDENGVFNPMGSALREQAAKIICLLRDAR